MYVVTVRDELGSLTACSTLDHLLLDRHIVEQELDLYTYLHHSKITVVQKNINSFQTITQQQIAKPLTLRFLAGTLTLHFVYSCEITY